MTCMVYNSASQNHRITAYKTKYRMLKKEKKNKNNNLYFIQREQTIIFTVKN